MNNNKQFYAFHSAMGTILRANPEAVKEAMEAEKIVNAEKRKANKTPSAKD